MPTVRVATYNLYLGADLALLFGARDLHELAERVEVVRAQLEATRFAERAQAVAAILRRERPHLVGLQEVSRWTQDDEVVVDFLPVLLEALGGDYAAHAVSPSFAGSLPTDDGVMGVSGANVVLVRRDVEVVGEQSAPFAASYDVPTGIPGVAFPVVRSWGAVDVVVDGGPLRFVVTHTEAYDDRTRDTQRDEVIAAHEDASVPVVLVGDLNATPDVVGLPDDWVDAWTGEDGSTCCQAADLANGRSRLSERIDYVVARGPRATNAWTVGDRETDRTPGGLWPSDHAAVLADLTF